MDKKRDGIQRKYREQMSEKEERESEDEVHILLRLLLY